MKFLKISIAAALSAVLLCACAGQTAEIDVKKAAEKIVNSVEFEDELSPIQPEIINAVYGFDSSSVYEAVSYMGSGATAEEVTVVKFKSLSEGDREKFTKRIENQKESYKSYMPEELKKLEAPVIEFSGSTAILCVCNDSAAAQKVIDGIIKS